MRWVLLCCYVVQINIKEIKKSVQVKPGVNEWLESGQVASRVRLVNLMPSSQLMVCISLTKQNLFLILKQQTTKLNKHKMLKGEGADSYLTIKI